MQDMLRDQTCSTVHMCYARLDCHAIARRSETRQTLATGLTPTSMSYYVLMAVTSIHGSEHLAGHFSGWSK
eukprot:8010967-Alexandrium_andersonii.AAC.1